LIDGKHILSEDRTEDRKRDHLRIVRGEDVNAKGITSGWARYRFRHIAMPELDLNEVDTSTTFLGKRLRAPLLISSMTGGTNEAEAINLQLAEAAEHTGVAMGVGSQRAALTNPLLERTYAIRRVAPTTVLLANLGAVQLNYGVGIDGCRRAVDMLAADALILHLNPLQEAVQPEGDTNFRGLYRKIEAVCRGLDVPVIVKEVGNGIGAGVARRLVECGVAAIDVAGAGGTSWSEVERYRIAQERGQTIAALFAGWGIPTTEAIREVRAALPELTLIGSGGIRSGLDVAKAIALGADLAGSAAPHLHRAGEHSGVDAVIDGLNDYITELRITMFLVGAGDVGALKRTNLEME
jgi:isopentenyl-diphosphate Delta-isomerase